MPQLLWGPPLSPASECPLSRWRLLKLGPPAPWNEMSLLVFWGRETEAEVWDVTFPYDPDRSLNVL